MKKIFALLFLCCCFLSSIFSATNGTQYVLPKNVYVGDTVEIRYIFRSDVNLLSDNPNNSVSELELNTDFRSFNSISEKCFVKKISISHIGTEYTLVMEVVVWDASVIDFPIFDLGQLIFDSLKNPSATNPVFWIDLDPIEVLSIAKKNNINVFQREKSPLLLPGTSILLVAFAFVILLVLTFLFFSITRIPIITSFIENFLYLASMKKNSRIAVKKLRKLYKKSVDLEDSDFASEFQSILREFFSFHFKEDFSSATTSDFSKIFARIFIDDIPVEFERFIDIFARTDYIRFAKGQVDSTFQKTEEIDEKKNLIDEVIFTISALGREGGSR